MISDMNDFVSSYLNSEKDKTGFLVESLVDMEINYLFTNDYNYLNNFTTFIPKNQEKGNLYDTKNVLVFLLRFSLEKLEIELKLTSN